MPPRLCVSAGDSPPGDFTHQAIPFESVSERPHVHEAKLPPRRGDAEVGGPCLRVSASQRAILLQPILPSRRCHSNPSRNVPTSMRQNSRRGAETQRLLAHVAASPRLCGRISTRSMCRSGRCHSNPSRNVPMSMSQKIPQRRGDAEVVGPWLRVSAATNETDGWPPGQVSLAQSIKACFGPDLCGRFSTSRFHPAGDAVGIRRGTCPCR